MERLKITGAVNADKVGDIEAVKAFIVREAEKKGDLFTKEDYQGDVSILFEYDIITYMYDKIGTVSARAVFSRNKGASLKSFEIVNPK